jgi:DNA-binding response OmpR family regulator
MPLIVVMEDDADIRTLMVHLLTHEGYEVLAAKNGSQGLELVESHRPDLIISDVQMPGMSGFQVLESVRKNPAVAATPVILLTALQDRVHVRHGMTAGADDYITKPFEPGELSQAVCAQLNRSAEQSARQEAAVHTAVKGTLDELYELRLAQELGHSWPTAKGSATDETFAHATVLFVDMANYSALTEQLSGSELSELVKTFYGSAGDTVHLFGARHMQFVGEGLLAVFVENNDTQSVKHGLRASRAALGLVDSAQRMRHYLQTRFPERQLPPFKVTVALHSGPVVLARMEDPLNGGPTQILPVGDAVSATMLLQKQAQALDWAIVASTTMLAGIKNMVKTGRNASVSLPGRSLPVEAAELLKAIV